MWTDQHDQPLLTVPEVAHIVRQHEQTVRRAMRSGEYPGAVKVGREWRISRANLDARLNPQPAAA